MLSRTPHETDNKVCDNLKKYIRLHCCALYVGFTFCLGIQASCQLAAICFHYLITHLHTTTLV
jgi:hypothetical protein